MPQLYLNNFQTQLIADVRAAPQTATPATELDYCVLRVSDGAAGTLLNPPAGSWYVLTAYKRSGSLESDYEILRVTAVDNSVIGECRLTVLRGQEGTAPRAYIAGDLLEMRMTAGGMREVVQTTDDRMSNPRAPTGAAGGVLAGQYPNPGFATPMATAADLEGKVDKVPGKGLSANDFSNSDVAKLEGVAAQATKNATDAQLRDRGTHTGTQTIATVAGLQTALDALSTHASAAKTTPVDTDEFGFSDSAASWILKKLTWANLKSALQSVFMPRVSFGGSTDKTRKMENAQIGAVDMFASLDGSGTDWPAQSLSTAWWNVFTFGTATQMSQVAQQAFSTRAAQFWFRHLHDAFWSPWYRLPYTRAETGFLVQDGGLLGYGSGCGGEVVQPTNKATSVTLNKPTGRIQLSNSAMNPGEVAYFSFFNSFITSNAVITLSAAWESYAPEKYRVEVAGSGGGVCLIRVTNISPTVTSEAQAIFFNVYGGSKL